MIYALCDYDLLQKYNITFKKYVEKCKELDVKIIQYRDKNSSLDDVKERLLEIRKLWNGILIINDYIELVEFCDGLHIGQEDLKKYKDVRSLIGNKILGLSTHNKEEILKANKMDLDYIGLGAYRPTTTKDVSSIGGEELLKIAKLSIHPVAIIGGVRLDDELDVKYKVIGSDICKLISTQ
jgi:thiamine-phosphate pyrophosphorylase